MRPEQSRTYDRVTSVVFLKTNEKFGGLSNMAGGFPLRVNGIRILTSEALYQACRFPHLPEVQHLIIAQNSPMTAKMKSKPYRHDSRLDWDQVRVKIMRWCLRVKLTQHWCAFSELLLATGERAIVEESRKDAFWGAKATDDGTLVGMNVLGRLLMELREAVRVEGRESLMSVQPLAIPDFLLGGRPIEVVTSRAPERDVEPGKAAVMPDRGDADGHAFRQPSLFDAPAVKEAPPAVYSVVRAKSVHVADLKPYAEYKESGLPWLGQVPGHWGTRRMKFLFKERTQKGFPNEPLLAATQSKGVVRKEDYGLRTVTAMNGLENLKLVEVGDFVISLRSFQGGIEVSHARGIISPAYTVLRPRDGFEPRSFKSYFKSAAFIRSLTLFVTGIREGQNIDYERLSRAFMPLPPPDEQAAIVRFLDWANGRLERAIRAKRKVIALLNEQKQAIIHRAVTRGLDPTVPLKPSGIPWLGDIPQHWEVSRAKYVFREVDQRSVDGREIHLAMSQRLGLVPSSQVSSSLRSQSYAGGKLCQSDDLILNRLKAHLGVFAMARQAGVISPDYTVFRSLRPTSVEYFESVLRSPGCRRELRIRAKGIVEGFWRLYTDDFYDIRLPVPPIEEQGRIVSGMLEATAGLNSTISRLEREIELLREYRTRLVADVVTGKLDVRVAALLLPDEAPPDTAEDEADLGDEIEREAEEIEA